jgi:hypothetical protein
VQDALLLFDLLVVLSDYLVYALDLTFQGRVEVVLDVVVASLLEALVCQLRG